MGLSLATLKLGKIAASIVSLLIVAFFAAHWVEYVEEGCTHAGLSRYEERGTAYVRPFSRGEPNLRKLTVRSRKTLPMMIETDFAVLREAEKPPNVTTLRAASKLVPSLIAYERETTHCSNFVAHRYEVDIEFRDAIKVGVTNGTISADDLLQAVTCCTLPTEGLLTSGIRSILEHYERFRRTDTVAVQ